MFVIVLCTATPLPKFSDVENGKSPGLGEINCTIPDWP
jgi:hypothetical protein